MKIAKAQSDDPAMRCKRGLLILLTTLCVGFWGFNFWQHTRQAPIRRHIQVGQDHLKAGLGAAAEAEWQLALHLDAQNVEAWELLGDYSATTENWHQAQRAFLQLSQLAPQTPRVWSRLAVASAHLNDESATRQAVEKALQQDANDIDALGLQATLLARDEKWEQQLEVLRRLGQLQPDNLKIAAQLADALTAAQKFEEARPLLAKIITGTPDFAPAYAMRAEGHLTANATAQQLNQAESDLRKSLSLGAEQEKARHLLAQLYVRRQQWPQAIIQYQELLNRHQDKTIYSSELASVYQKAGKRRQALAMRQRVALIAQRRDLYDVLKSRLANDPNNFENNLQMGLLLLRSPQPLHTDEYIGKAISLRPHDPRAKAAVRELETLYLKHLEDGLKALRQGNIKKADHEISRIMLLRPRDKRTIEAVQQVTQAATKATNQMNFLRQPVLAPS
ncbi:MAG TPA: tetratricopeptide repeat protein [Abditibacteriaceae bacterium]